MTKMGSEPGFEVDKEKTPPGGMPGGEGSRPLGVDGTHRKERSCHKPRII